MIEMKFHLLSHVKRTIFVVLWILFATKCTYGISVNFESLFIILGNFFFSACFAHPQVILLNTTIVSSQNMCGEISRLDIEWLGSAMVGNYGHFERVL